MVGMRAICEITRYFIELHWQRAVVGDNKAKISLKRFSKQSADSVINHVVCTADVMRTFSRLPWIQRLIWKWKFSRVYIKCLRQYLPLLAVYDLWYHWQFVLMLQFYLFICFYVFFNWFYCRIHMHIKIL